MTKSIRARSIGGNGTARRPPDLQHAGDSGSGDADALVQRISAAVGFTTAPVAIGATTGVLPEFGRWQDVQRLFGIKKGTLYNLVNDGMVKTVHLRRKGNEHGCTLFYLPGISQLLHATMDAQNPPKSQPSNQIDLDLGSTAHTQAQ